MNLFIDTNIFLSFYNLTSDDLEELKKLVILLRKKKLVLLLPEQVIHEFRRNRAKKISEAISKLRGQKVKIQIPQLARGYEEYEKLRLAHKEFVQHLDALIENISADVSSDLLEADTVIDELFDVAKILPRKEKIIAKARQRVELGDPPGKKGSIGDAVNWEALLDDVPDGEDIFFISEDGDFYSFLDQATIDEYLVEEWGEKKSSTVHPYNRLSSFFQDHFPDIKLASELEKDLLIEELVTSSSFDATRMTVSKLRRFSDFTKSQVDKIVTATITNNQIYWIATYVTIKSFLESIVTGREDSIEPEKLVRIKYVIEKIEPYGEIRVNTELPPDYEVPF